MTLMNVRHFVGSSKRKINTMRVSAHNLMRVTHKVSDLTAVTSCHSLPTTSRAPKWIGVNMYIIACSKVVICTRLSDLNSDECSQAKSLPLKLCLHWKLLPAVEVIDQPKEKQ
jgi:hypothetical protein